MKMDAEIRVATDAKYKLIYSDLRSSRVVDEAHELFFICAVLGYRAGKRKPLGKQRDDRFWSKTIKPREWASFYAMQLVGTDMDIMSVRDDKDVIQSMEEYANAGMEILLDEFLRDYLTAASSEPSVDSTRAGTLVKDLLHYLYDQVDQEALPKP